VTWADTDHVPSTGEWVPAETLRLGDVVWYPRLLTGPAVVTGVRTGDHRSDTYVAVTLATGSGFLVLSHTEVWRRRGSALSIGPPARSAGGDAVRKRPR